MRRAGLWMALAMGLAWAMEVRADDAADLDAQVRRICQDLRRKLEREDAVDLAATTTSLEALGRPARPLLVQMLLVHKLTATAANAQFRLVLLGVIAKADDGELAEYGPKLAAGYRSLPELQRRIALREPKLSTLPPLPRPPDAKSQKKFQDALGQQRALIEAYNKQLEEECKKASSLNALVYQCQRLLLDLLTRSISDKTVEDWLTAFTDRIREDDQTVLLMIEGLHKVLPKIPATQLTDKQGAGALHAGLAKIAEKGIKAYTLYNYADMAAQRRFRGIPDVHGGAKPVIEDSFSVLFIGRRDVVPAAEMEPLLAALRLCSRGPIQLKPAGAP